LLRRALSFKFLQRSPFLTHRLVARARRFQAKCAARLVETLRNLALATIRRCTARTTRMQTLKTHSGPAHAFGARAVASPAPASVQPERDRLYPRHLVGGWRDANGTLVHIRPITAADAELIRELVRAPSFETRYLRFMGPVT
jgi:hypothetical protein